MFHVLRIMGFGIAWLTYGLAGMGALLVLVGLIAPVGWLFIPVAIFCAMTVSKRLARRRASIVLSYVEQPIAMNLPVLPMITAAAASEQGLARYRLWRLGQQLHHGASLPRALHQAVPELSPRVTSLLRTAHRCGRLPATLRRLRQQAEVADVRTSANATPIWSYPLALIIAALFILLLFMVFIFPRFEVIFEDFDTELPAVTIGLINLGKWVTGHSDGQILPGALLLLAIVIIVLTAYIVLQLRWSRPMIEPLLWHLPVLRTGERAWAMADVCHLLGQLLEAGAPLPQALAAAAELRTNVVLRSKVMDWADRVAAGQTIADATRAAGLPSLCVGTLATAQATGNLPQALRFLERYYDHRFSRVAELLQASILPITTLLLAVLVGWIVVGLLMPLVTLIYSLVPEGGVL